MRDRDQYALGIDYGTESGRAVLVNVRNGEIAGTHVTAYPHGVITDLLPDSNFPLPPRFALQHPDDYLYVLLQSVPQVIQSSGVKKDDIIGLGIDFTSCTMLPVDEQFEPLCCKPEWAGHPHAWVKLWKHHGAQSETEQLNALTAESYSDLLKICGGKISSESMLPKALEILNEAPEIYKAADYFVEAGDWVVARLTGNLKRSLCSAGFKSLWTEERGYPPQAFFAGLDARFADIAETKLRGEVVPVDSKAGGLTTEMAALLGLPEGLAVSPAMIDAHAAVLGAGVRNAGTLTMVMGTSTCHLILNETYREIPGISGVVKDSIIPGFYGYEAGQSAVGDMFAWFIQQHMTSEMREKANAAGMSDHEWMETLAARLKPGQSGLVAIDWFNGNRSPLNNMDLSGCIIGYTLSTRSEEVYRALLEATAFGAKSIIENYRRVGIPVTDIMACGGLPHRNKLLMQIYADVLNMNIRISSSVYSSAIGASILGAVAAGPARGGYLTIQEAAANMCGLSEEVYKPNWKHSAIYCTLYQEYDRLKQYFGLGGNSVMARLLELKEKTMVV